MPDYYPAFLDLRGRRCLVVGGGVIGERKTRELVACGADVVVVSPRLTPELAGLVACSAIVHRPRRFDPSDVLGCALVVVATRDRRVDAEAAAAARRRRVLVNVTDDPAKCDFISPSVLRRGELQIAVSTGGRSPALAKEIRTRLEPLFGHEYAELVERVGVERARVRASTRTRPERLAAGTRVARAALPPTLGTPRQGRRAPGQSPAAAGLPV